MLNTKPWLYRPCIFNKSREKIIVIAENPQETGSLLYGEQFVELLETNCRTLLMVKAGKAGTDAAIDPIKAAPDKGNIDGGNHSSPNHHSP